MYSHGFLKVAAASPVARTGDAMFNVKEILKVINEAKNKKPSMICFPEMCIVGYSVRDLIFQKYLYKDNLEAIEYLLKNNTYEGVIIFGSYLIINDCLFNCSFIAQKNKIIGIVPKNFLPHTNEFEEDRYYLNGVAITKHVDSINLFGYEIPFGKMIFINKNKDIMFGAEICGDMWAPISPNEVLFSHGALIVFNSSASPTYIGKKERRRLLTNSTSYKFNGAYVYVSNNASESTSEVVFSSHKIITENGAIVAEDDEISLDSKIIYGDIDISKLHFLRRNNSYYKAVSDLYRDASIKFINYDLQEDNEFTFEKPLEKLPFVPKDKKDLQEIIDIQAASIIKRLRYINIENTVLGVSGGLDSTLALLSLCYAYDKYKLDRKKILGVTLPSEQTSSATYTNAIRLMEKLGITRKEITIQDDVYRQLKTIGHDAFTKDVTYENVQARYRTYTLMNLANLTKAIVVGTSDMSEVALGWSTFNGDQMAMYGLNAGIPKTLVKEVVNYYKMIFPEIAEIIDGILQTPISPELSGSDQATEDIIGKYEVNDFILYHFLVNGDDTDRIVYLLTQFMDLDEKKAKEYVQNFNNRFYSQQYKRLTMPEGVKVVNISLSPRTELKLNGDIYRPR